MLAQVLAGCSLFFSKGPACQHSGQQSPFCQHLSQHLSGTKTQRGKTFLRLLGISGPQGLGTPVLRFQSQFDWKEKGGFVKGRFWRMYTRSSFGHRRSSFRTIIPVSDTVVLFFLFPRSGEKKKESIHRSSKELFFAPKKGGHRRKISVVDMVFLVFIGLLYPPPAWQVFLLRQKSSPKEFFRWWSCTYLSSLTDLCLTAASLALPSG